ncbi:MAG TPA: hypothetical protein VKB07_10660 [Gaiellaceae bacterium]|nr:hypothetical protein [Gaiellaceae bacterium]
MQGYEVVSHGDENVVGRVVDKVGGNYIVERGLLRKTKHAVPEQFAHVDEAGERIVLTISKEMVEDSPKVNGDVDEDAIAAHYGLTDTSVDNPPGFVDSEVGEQRIATRQEVEPTEGIRESPALLGDRYDDTVVERGERTERG